MPDPSSRRGGQQARAASQILGTARPHRGLGIFAGIVAFGAYAGALGLAFGFLDMGSTINQRLPMHSPVLGGIALALIVGIPNTLVAIWAFQRDPRTSAAVGITGGILVAWIAVEVLFIRSFSFLQIVFGAVGVGYLWYGRRLQRQRT